jgi:hypothetical protein
MLGKWMPGRIWAVRHLCDRTTNIRCRTGKGDGHILGHEIYIVSRVQPVMDESVCVPLNSLCENVGHFGFLNLKVSSRARTTSSCVESKFLSYPPSINLISSGRLTNDSIDAPRFPPHATAQNVCTHSFRRKLRSSVWCRGARKQICGSWRRRRRPRPPPWRHPGARTRQARLSSAATDRAARSRSRSS